MLQWSCAQVTWSHRPLSYWQAFTVYLLQQQQQKYFRITKKGENNRSFLKFRSLKTRRKKSVNAFTRAVYNVCRTYNLSKCNCDDLESVYIRKTKQI